MSLMGYELKLSQENSVRFIGGIDEVGRGCLAGPLVTAIVVFDTEKLAELKDEEIIKTISQIKDSKKLSEKKREELSEFIKINAHFYHIQETTNQTIDQINISKSTNNSFLENFLAAQNNSQIDFVLTDAFKIKGVEESRQKSLIKGDNTSLSIAAASIIAKVYRDNLMKELSNNEEYKIYEFEKHKGYGTAAHIEIIKRCGPSNLHRKSFEPIKSMINNN